MSITLEQLQKRASELEAELNDIKAAIRVIQNLSGSSVSGTGFNDIKKPSIQPAIEDTGVINLDNLNLPKKTKSNDRETLHAQIAALTPRFGNQEFSINHVLAALEAIGKGNKAKHFKTRISIVIRKMVEDGSLVLTHKGVGSDPHLYRVAEKQVSLLKE